MTTIIQIIQPDATNRPSVPVAVKTMTDEPPGEALLEHVFGWFNAGSGMECPEFYDANMRSLSVGDYVVVTKLEKLFSQVSVHRCDNTGWVDVLYEQMLDDISKHRNMPDWMRQSMQVGDWQSKDMTYPRP